MKITAKKAAAVSAVKADVLVVPVGSTPDASAGVLAGVDSALGGRVARLVERGDAKGRVGYATLLDAGDGVKAAHVLLVGVGDGDAGSWREAGMAAGSRARDVGARTAAVVTDEDDAALVAALAEGFAYGNYRFDRYRTAADASTPAATSLNVVGGPLSAADARRASAVAAAVAAARDLVNTPANDLTPTAMAARARELGERHAELSVKVLGVPELTRMKAGAMLSVARGSAEPPALIVMTYTPKGAAKGGDVLGLVGKGVTFDSGGISIKPSAGMEEMKMDMGGGAAVLEAMGAIAELGVKQRVVGVIGATENMPSGTATRPGDVVTAMNGATIEVVNTDAEGRLVLADALYYTATKAKATHLVDFATLTGAMVIALGEVYAGLWGSDDAFTARVRAAADDAGDLVWPMPLHRRYDPLIRSKVADLSNAAASRMAPGAVYAAQFLGQFTDDTPWCHVDVAGTAMVKGAGTGFGVGLCVALAESMAEG